MLSDKCVESKITRKIFNKNIIIYEKTKYSRSFSELSIKSSKQEQLRNEFNPDAPNLPKIQN